MHKYLYFVSRSKLTVCKSIYIITHGKSVVSQQILYIIPIYSHHFPTLYPLMEIRYHVVNCTFGFVDMNGYL
nr:MAG TPA: hypothetical protein [Caudoviricetes sp.]